MAKEAGQQRFGRASSIQESELKICDLCGSLNLGSNVDCFVCGWHGHFEHNHDVVRAAVEMAVRRHGRLELQHLTNMRTYSESRPSFHSKFCAWLERLWKWLSG